MFQNRMAASTRCTFDTPGSQRPNSLPFLHRDLAYGRRTGPNGCVEALFMYIVPVFVHVNYWPLTTKVFCYFFYLFFCITGALGISTYNSYNEVNG